MSHTQFVGHDSATHARVSRLLNAPAGEAPGLGVVKRIVRSCPRCDGPAYEFYSPETGELVTAPPCDRCTALAVVRTVHPWCQGPLTPSSRNRFRVPVGLTHTYKIAMPPASVAAILTRLSEGDLGQFGLIDAGQPTAAEEFCPPLARPLARAYLAVQNRSGVVRARFDKPHGVRGAVIDVAVLLTPSDTSVAYLMSGEVGGLCFGARV